MDNGSLYMLLKNIFNKKEVRIMKKERIQVTLYNKTLKEIDLSDFTVITEGLFSNRSDVVKVVLPYGVEQIGNNAFENCNNLEEVVFPESLKLIGEEAFVNCFNLKKKFLYLL